MSALTSTIVGALIGGDTILEQYIDYNVQTILQRNSAGNPDLLMDRIGRRSLDLIIRRELHDKAQPQNNLNGSSVEANVQELSKLLRESLEISGDLPLSDLTMQICKV